MKRLMMVLVVGAVGLVAGCVPDNRDAARNWVRWNMHIEPSQSNCIHMGQSGYGCDVMLPDGRVIGLQCSWGQCVLRGGIQGAR